MHIVEKTHSSKTSTRQKIGGKTTQKTALLEARCRHFVPRDDVEFIFLKNAVKTAKNNILASVIFQNAIFYHFEGN